MVLAILRIWYGGAEFAGGIEIPQSLLILSGLTAFTFAGAKGIIKSKKEKHDLGAGQAGVPPEPFKKPGEGPPKLSQLVEDDNQRVDVGDFQLLMLTLIAAGMYVVQAWEVFRVIELHRTVSLPDVDPTFLAIFGIGQGMYLVKKQLGETPAAGPKDGEDSAAKPPKQPSDGGK